LTLNAHIAALQRQAEALTSSVEALRAANDAVQQTAAETNVSIRRLDRHFSSLPETISPTLFSNEDLVILDDCGRQTVGFRVSKNTPHAAYAHFEQSFRGTHDRVVALLKPYVELFANSSRVIDVGCGRGEFLDLLRDAEISGVGVDIDEGMISIARARNLEVHCQDGADFLVSHSLEFDALFSSQVVEHLAFEDLVAFLTCVKQHLMPNSTVVLETTNPYSAAGLQAYRCDPTHKTLLFPEVLTVLVRACGFSGASVVFPTEWASFDAAKRTHPSYAVIART
jgi:2-polyprenyl-3-methyl-5-hydroxy-6-metoxy-1,4-benzoquinol methylase